MVIFTAVPYLSLTLNLFSMMASLVCFVEMCGVFNFHPWCPVLNAKSNGINFIVIFVWLSFLYNMYMYWHVFCGGCLSLLLTEAISPVVQNLPLKHFTVVLKPMLKI